MYIPSNEIYECVHTDGILMAEMLSEKNTNIPTLQLMHHTYTAILTVYLRLITYKLLYYNIYSYHNIL